MTHSSGAGTYELNPIRCKPMEHLQEQETDEEQDEGRIEFIAKDGQRQKGFSYSKPASLLQSLRSEQCQYLRVLATVLIERQQLTSTSNGRSGPKKADCNSLPNMTVWKIPWFHSIWRRAAPGVSIAVSGTPTDVVWGEGAHHHASIAFAQIDSSRIEVATLTKRVEKRAEEEHGRYEAIELQIRST